MSIFLFFKAFFGLLVFGSIAINGFFSVTRGHYETRPDGKKVKKGMLLKGWYFFWFREWPQPVQIQYRGSEFSKMVNTWQSLDAPFSIIAKIDVDKDDDYLFVDGLSGQDQIDAVASRIGVVVKTKKESDAIEVRFYKEYPHYMFPECVRDWLAGCIVCHSSWLGSIVFWGAYSLAVRANIHALLFSWANNSIVTIFCTWIAYCFCLAYTSNILRRQISK